MNRQVDKCVHTLLKHHPDKPFERLIKIVYKEKYKKTH